ncbi:hypothetical protein IGI39_000371 [Enterococcus sp. AZ135]|uniref:hypothetical protein n=1 Tax=unclassified Enterococcus TaxID=2608891 RepID=UPI003F212E65
MQNFDDNWKDIRSQVKENMLSENKDNQLEAMRAIKQMDDIFQQTSQLISGTLEEANSLKEMSSFDKVAKESILYQQKKDMKKLRTKMDQIR